MDNVLEFKKREPVITPNSDLLVSITVYMTPDGAYEVEAEINDEYDDGEIFDALMASTQKFGLEMGILDDEGFTD